MRDGSRVADGLYIKRVLIGIGGFPFLLSLLVLLYSKASYDFETALTFVLFCLVLTCSKRTSSPVRPAFEITLLLPISPSFDPARYTIYAAAASSNNHDHEDGIDDPKSYKATTESLLAEKWDTVMKE